MRYFLKYPVCERIIDHKVIPLLWYLLPSMQFSTLSALACSINLLNVCICFYFLSHSDVCSCSIVNYCWNGCRKTNQITRLIPRVSTWDLFLNIYLYFKQYLNIYYSKIMVIYGENQKRYRISINLWCYLF